MTDDAAIVWFFANGFGDTVIARPAMKALTCKASARTIAITQAGPHRFLFDDLEFADVIEVPMRSTSSGREFETAHLIERVGRCDVMISAVSWISDSLRTLRADLHPTTTVGFFEEYDVRPSNVSNENWVARTFSLLEPLGRARNIEAFRAPLLFSAAASAQARASIQEARAKKTLVVHTETLKHKQWDDAAWAGVLSGFLAKRPEFTALVVDKRPPSHVIIGCHDRVRALPELSLEAAMCVTSQADVFLGIDSCMLHVADAHLIPVVALFVATDPMEFGPFWTRGRTIAARRSGAVEGATRALLRISGPRIWPN